MDESQIKAEMMRAYEAELDNLLSECRERENFRVIEEELEKFARATLPRMLESLGSVDNSSQPDEG